jgi:hypothetical protein
MEARYRLAIAATERYSILLRHWEPLNFARINMDK